MQFSADMLMIFLFAHNGFLPFQVGWIAIKFFCKAFITTGYYPTVEGCTKYYTALLGHAILLGFIFLYSPIII